MSPVPIGPPRSTMARNETVTHSWFVVDAAGHIVGRLATQIATVLMGKHRPDYTPHVDTGDYVVVLNAHLVRFSGKSLAHDTKPTYGDVLGLSWINQTDATTPWYVSWRHSDAMLVNDLCFPSH